MLDNLRLDPTTVSLTDLQGNTNASDQALTYLKNGGGPSPYTSTAVVNKTSDWNTTSPNNAYEYPYINNTYKNTVNSDSSKNWGPGSHKYGVYYNYCAASAGSYCYASGASTGDASEDLCPAGWRMPSGNTSGGYGVLASKYSTTTATDTNSLQYNLSTPLSGYFYGSSASDQGSDDFFWSSTVNSGSYSCLFSPRLKYAII